MSDYNIREAFEKIEDELIDSMMRNFSRHRAEETKEVYNWTQWQAEQLKSLEEYRKHNAKKFGKRFKTINGKIEEMIRTAKADGNASQEAEILEAVKDGFKAPKKPSAHSTAEFFKVNDRKLDALIKSTTDDLKRAETAVLRMSNDKYRKAIFNAQVAMNTGAVTYEKAVDIACKDMLNAGLNCVEYKNGARHTLSDYADMAVKTANKRAYLRGEGEKRAEWGVSLVVVNSRQGGCPDCAKYIGKVFIDDVYSNGKKSDGNYPLLSTAIKNGLFHPRCKDSTSTYYPELDDLDAPLSEDEIKELDRQRGIEEKQQYAQRQAERFDRRAEYSLDEDNKRIAQTRADEWHDRANMLEEKVKKAENTSPESVAKSQKTVIMKSEGVGNLEQAKKRDHKIFITVIALDKITKSAVPKYSKVQNSLIDEVHKELLARSKNSNNSNEVACLFNLNSGERAYRNGSEHKVNIFENPIAYAMADSAEDKSLFLAHNHPSIQTFSYSDLGVFLYNDSIGSMSVVSNTGDVHILFKSDGYSYTKAIEKLMNIKDEFGGYSPDVDLPIVKSFLKNSEKIGINKY